MDYQKEGSLNMASKTTKIGILCTQLRHRSTYRLYLLALAGTPEQGAMNQLKGYDPKQPGKYFLAATYAIIGKKTLEKSILDRLKKLLILTQNQAIPLVSDHARPGNLTQTYLLLGNKGCIFSCASYRNERWEITAGMPPPVKLMEFGLLLLI